MYDGLQLNAGNLARFGIGPNAAVFGVANLAALQSLGARPATVEVSTGQARGTWDMDVSAVGPANGVTVVQTASGAFYTRRLVNSTINPWMCQPDGSGNLDYSPGVQIWLNLLSNTVDAPGNTTVTTTYNGVVDTIYPMTTQASRTGLRKQDRINISGPRGLYWTDATEFDSLITLSGTRKETAPWGQIPVAFPYGTSGMAWTLVPETASATLSADYAPGATKIAVSDASLWVEGDQVILKQERIQQGCEDRNYVVYGENNRVTKANTTGPDAGTIDLAYPTEHGYYAQGIAYQGKVGTGSTSTTIQLNVVAAATTAAADTSSLTYANGTAGVGATLTGTVNTAVTVDGFTFTATGQRLLVKNDTQSPSGAFNGIYQLTQLQTGAVAPIFTRATDFDTPTEMNAYGNVIVTGGTANANTAWLLSTVIVSIGTTAALFVQNAAYVGATNGEIGGRRITLTPAAGGAAQVRFIATYNPATGIAYLDTAGTNPAMPVWNPVAVSGDALKIDCPTYLSVVDAPEILIDGISMDGVVSTSTSIKVGISIFYAFTPTVTGLRMGKGFPEEGVHFEYCLRPQMTFSNGTDQNYSNMGHFGSTWNCTGAILDGANVLNNRSPFDVAGPMSNARGIWRNTVVDGGPYAIDNHGVIIPNSVAQANAGISAHGACFNWIYQNNILRNLVNPVLVRGRGQVFENTTIEGPFYRGFRWTEGSHTVIDGVNIVQNVGRYTSPQPNPPCVVQTATIVAQSWAATGGGQITYTTSSLEDPPNLYTGARCGVVGSLPSGYSNRQMTCIAGTTSRTIVVAASDPGASVTFGQLQCRGGALVEINYQNWLGDGTLKNVTSLGYGVMYDDMVMVTPGTGDPWVDTSLRLNRTNGKVTIDDIDVKLYSPFTYDYYLFGTDNGANFASGGLNSPPWDIQVLPGDVKVIGGGTYAGLAPINNFSWCMQQGTGMGSCFNRIGPYTYFAVTLDDTAIAIPLAGNFNVAAASITDSQSIAGAFFNRTWPMAYVGTSQPNGYCTANALPAAAPLSGTTGTDNQLNVAYDRKLLYIEDRLGAGARTWSVKWLT